MYQNAYSKSIARQMAIAVALGLLAQVLPVATAATKTFDGGGTNGATLDVSANWNSDGIPVTTDEALLDDTSFALPATLAFSTAQTFGDLIINSTSLTNVSLTGGSSYNLTLSGLGGNVAANAVGGAPNDLLLAGGNVHSKVTIGGGSGAGKLGLALAKDGQFDVVNADATLNVTGIVSGACSLTKTGAGTLTLAGVNSHGGAGKTNTLSVGTLNINNATALGNAANVLVINGGTTIDNSSGAAITTGNYPLSLNGDFAFTGTTNLAFGTGATTLGVAAGAARTITANAGNLTLGGAVANGTTATSIIKAGAGALTLSGANTFGGGVTLSSGTLIVNNTTALGAATGAFLISGGTLDTVAAGITMVNANPITIGNDFVFGGSGNLNLSTGAITDTGDRTITLGGSAKTLTLGGILTNGKGAIQTTTVNGAGNTLSLGSYALSGNGNNYIDVIQGSGNVTITGLVFNGSSGSTASGLTYGGGGVLTLSGNNTYNGLTTVNSGTLTLSGANTGTGGVTLNSGTLKLGNSAALGATAGKLTINGGTLDVTAAITVSQTNAVSINSDFTFGGANTLNLGTGAIDLGTAAGNSRAIMVTANTLTLGGNITNGTTATQLIKGGAGTLALAAANSFSGGLIIKAGTVAGSNTGASLGNGTIIIGDTAGSANAALSLNSNVGYNQPIIVQAGNTGAASLTLNNNITYSGAIALSNHDLTISFASSGGESVSGSSITGTGNLRVTNGNNNYPTLGDAINIVGSISNSSVNGLVEGIYLTGNQGTGVVNIVQNSTNIAFILSGSNAYNGTATALLGTLWFQKYQSWSQNAGNVPATPTTVACSNGTTLAITYGAAAGAFSDISVASLLANATFGSGTVFRIDDGASATWSNMSAVISSAAGKPQNLTRTGTSTGGLALTGANTYTGVTTLTSGTLGAGGTENPGASGPFGNPQTPAGSIVFNGGRLGWAAPNTYDYSARFAINNGKAYAFDAHGQSVMLSSALPTNGANALAIYDTSVGGFASGGKIVLAGSNTFTGAVSIPSGVLSVSSLNYISSGTWAHHADGYSNLGAPGDAASGTITIGVFNGGSFAQLSYTGAGETTDRNLVQPASSGNPYNVLDQSGSGPLKFTGTLSIAGGSSFILQGSTGASGELAGLISGTGSLVKSGTGTWILSCPTNTQTATTTINGGVLSAAKLANGTGNSSLGASSNNAANLVINGGTLRYTGTGDSMDRCWTLGNGNATIDASGGGALVMSGTNVFVTANAARVLTLTGTNTGFNTYGGLLINNGSGALSLVKDGVGTWVLAGTNTYSGATAVSNGILAISGRSVSTTLVYNAAVLTGTGAIVTNNATAVTVNAGGILDPGSVGGMGTLTVTGNVTFASGGLFRVDASGASSDLLAVSGTVGAAGGPVLVKVNATGAGPWKIMTATGGITASFTPDASDYTLTKRNANTELWLAGRGATGIFFR